MSENVLKDLRMYGPLPAEAPSRNPSVLPFIAMALTMASSGVVRTDGKPGFGSLDVSTTVKASGAEAFTPERSADGPPFILTTRASENRTSADVSWLRSENTTSWRSLNVKVLASSEEVYEAATHGTGVDWSPPSNVSSVL